ncbi:MAG TPA: hypothetical protein VII76_04510 [Acidimicrobiales bacterium]
MTPAERCDAIIKMIDEVLEGACGTDPNPAPLAPGFAEPRFAMASSQDRP